MRAKRTIQRVVLVSVGILGAGLAALWFARDKPPVREPAADAGFTGIVHARESEGPEVTDFRVQLENYNPPNEAQVKTLLQGAKARPHAGQFRITAARVTTFRTNGAPELFVETENCVYDYEEKTVSSAALLQIQTADKRFLLEGEGFLLRQTNSILSISNRVHTVVRNAPGNAPKP